jgi:hypothetical protein
MTANRSEKSETDARTVIRPHEGGYVAEGPGFYVWDEDRTEVLRAVLDLERGCVDTPPTRRFLLIEPDELEYGAEPRAESYGY